MIKIGKKHRFNLQEFSQTLFQREEIEICQDAIHRLNETRKFVDYLLEKNIKVYGLTTGFADLRSKSISSNQAAKLSENLIASHDAGIGPTLSKEVILGAMIVRASSLAKGYSGIQLKSLQTLVSMINCEIVPLIPSSGSLGASGDLAFLARLGRAMQGENVPVFYQGNIISANEALKKNNIPHFEPHAKEGLAITNGTAFMISMLSIAYLKLIQVLENMLAMQGLFFNSVGAIDAAFNACMQNVRNQLGQKIIAEILSDHFEHSPFIDFQGVQNDYCIRCLPQIFGPKVESIIEQYPKIERELNAATDNPLFFKGDEISPDVSENRIIQFNGDPWTILSGGNFHGEYITSICDTICAANAKIALTLERQITYMLNPFRNNNHLPCYLITDPSKVGFLSGYMITQYTANSLAQKIAQFGQPTSVFNITSANESEDIVSYGATSAERLLEQIERFQELNAIYLTVSMQAYSIVRHNHLKENNKVPSELIAEKIFQAFKTHSGESYPTEGDSSFDKRYEKAQEFLSTNTLQQLIGFPLVKMNQRLMIF